MKKVLIVDDSKLLRQKLRTIMETLEVEVIAEAVDGEDAVRKYREFNPDFVTMDIEMPNVNGIQAADRLVQINPRLMVLWITTIANQKVIHEARRVCQSVVIPKPIDEEKIKEGIEKLLTLRRQRPEED